MKNDDTRENMRKTYYERNDDDDARHSNPSLSTSDLVACEANAKKGKRRNEHIILRPSSLARRCFFRSRRRSARLSLSLPVRPARAQFRALHTHTHTRARGFASCLSRREIPYGKSISEKGNRRAHSRRRPRRYAEGEKLREKSHPFKAG